jgi:hypothetical protein
VQSHGGTLPLGEQVDRGEHPGVDHLGLLAHIGQGGGQTPPATELARRESERHLPDPRERVSELRTSSQRLRERFGDGVIGHVPVARVGEHGRPQPPPMLSVEALDALPDGHLRMLHFIRIERKSALRIYLRVRISGPGRF